MIFRWLRRPVDPIDALIEKNAFKVRYAGHDDALRIATAEKRKKADELRARAADIDAGKDEQPSVILTPERWRA